jgi:Leucine-rich repeat (LRR) protein
LNLSHNLLSDLPESLSKLSVLKTLNLDYNKLTYLPTVLGALSSLKHFKAKHNQIKDVTVLLECSNLQTIDIRKNFIDNMPIDLPLKLTKLTRYEHGS